MKKYNIKSISDLTKYTFGSSPGNFAILGALVLPALIVVAGGAVDVANAFSVKKDLQERLDAGVLSAAPQAAHNTRKKRVEEFMTLVGTTSVENSENLTPNEFVAGTNTLEVISNPDGSVTANYSIDFKPQFLSMIGMSSMPINVSSTAFAEPKAANATCIYALTANNVGIRINSGANIKSEKCEVAVHSTSNESFIMNSGSVVDTRKFCVQGTKNINNGGTLSNLQVGCTPPADPYAGKIPLPTIPNICTTSGAFNPGTHSLKPGRHCNTTFNGTSNVTFEPGLHIIDGTMIINSGSTIKAEGVTFYFPNSDSTLLANGGLTSTMTAPTSGTYKGILMFENPTKSEGVYIFNGSKGEIIEGVIHLPSRHVTFNSLTKQKSKLTMVVNSIIFNPNSWQIEPYDGVDSTKSGIARLIR